MHLCTMYIKMSYQGSWLPAKLYRSSTLHVTMASRGEQAFVVISHVYVDTVNIAPQTTDSG